MCKKLVLAAVAILVGTAVVRHTSFGSLAQVWWHDAKQAVERQVPPEVQIKQLEVEVGKIDRDIKKNLSKLANQEVDTQALEENVAALKEAQSKLRADIEAMTKGLKGIEAATDRVTFNSRSYPARELTGKLDRTVALYEAKKAELKSKEQLLGLKKQALEAAHDRISAMADQKERLHTIIAKFQTRLELNRTAAVRSEVGIDLDDSQVGISNELAKKIDHELAVQEKELAVFAKYGYSNVAPKIDETKPTADVVNAAEKALKDDQFVTKK